MTSHLDAAEQQLRRLAEIEAAGGRESLLMELAWLVDHVGRVGCALPDDLRYQAEKAGVLLEAALTVHWLALENYVGRPATDTAANVELHSAAETLRVVARAAGRVMLQAGRPVDPKVARAAKEAAGAFAAWAGQVSACAGSGSDAELW